VTGLVYLLLLACLCVSPASAETVVLEAGGSMSYLANHEGAPPGATGLLATTIAGSVSSIYTRTTFSVAQASDVFSVFYGQDYDDGTVVWLNGVEVYRSPEMRNWALTWNTVSGPHESSNGTSPDYSPLRDITEAALPLLVDGVNVLAIGVWNNTASSEDLVLVPQLILNRQLRRAPYLQQGTSESVLVRWRTGQSVGSRVLYGPDPGSLTGVVSLATATTEHEVPLVGLTPSTRYYYAVGSPDEILAGGDLEHFFVTPPPTGTAVPTRIWVLGDSGQGNVLAGEVRDAYYDYADDVSGGGASARHTDLLLMLGDNAYSQGLEQQYQDNLFDIYPRTLRQTVLWPTIGNHDQEDTVSGTWPYYDAFSLPTAGEAGGEISGTEKYYAFDHGNIHFIVLNSLEITTPMFGTAMLGWLEADLQDATEDWIVAYWHHPPYSKGGCRCSTITGWIWCFRVTATRTSGRI
jgi:hypothetical protein